MKKWSAPAIAELNLEATESGLFCVDFETCLLFNDSLKKCPEVVNNDPKGDNDTPNENDDVVDHLS